MDNIELGAAVDELSGAAERWLVKRFGTVEAFLHGFGYHNRDHGHDVALAAERIASELYAVGSVPAETVLLAPYAGWRHDAAQGKGHERRSARLAAQAMRERGIPERHIATVAALPRRTAPVIPVAVVDDRGPLVAVAYDVHARVCHCAVRGGGHFRSGRRSRVSSLAPAGLAITVARRGREDEPVYAWTGKSMPPADVSFLEAGCLVATGAWPGFVVDGVGEAEAAVVELLVAEAGGRVSSAFGARAGRRRAGVVVSNGVDHEYLEHWAH